MKKLLILVGVLGGAVVALVAITIFSINPIIEKAVNSYGPELLQTEVVLNSADVSFMSGEGSLSGLFVGSPKGFKAPHTMKLGAVSVKLDTGSLTEDTVIVERLVVESPDLTYEMSGKRDNFTALLQNVQRATGGSSSSEEHEHDGDASSEDSGAQKKVVIRDLLITGAKVKVAFSALGGKGMTLELPDIHVKNIGDKKGGASPAEAMQKVLGELNSAVSIAVTGAFTDVTKQLQKGVEHLGEGVKGGASGVENTVKGIKKLFE